MLSQIKNPVPYWHICAQSVMGTTHQRQGIKCQDYRHVEENSSSIRIIAIADGHGSTKSPKSELGAEFAARQAVSQLKRFAYEMINKPLDLVRKYAEDELPRNLMKGWINTVSSREPERNDLETLLLEYGTTVIAVLITNSYILYLQLGDGDILRVASDLSVRRPIPKNPRLFANETTSLSMTDKRTKQPNSWTEMVVVLEPLFEPYVEPSLIVVSTDGYANSFRTEADFLQVGPDLLNTINSAGWEKVKSDLKGWLEDVTVSGSGDDITVGLLWNNPPKGTMEINL